MSFGLLDLTKDILTGTVDKVSTELAAERLAICNTCPDLSFLRACTHCGCFMDAKVKYTKASCPIGKWGSTK
jgi:hypothetical protein